MPKVDMAPGLDRRAAIPDEFHRYEAELAFQTVAAGISAIVQQPDACVLAGLSE